MEDEQHAVWEFMYTDLGLGDDVSVVDVLSLGTTADWYYDYDFVIWHFQGGTGQGMEDAADAMVAAEIPVLVVDDDGFHIAHALGITDSTTGGIEVPPSEDPYTYNVSVDLNANGAYHFLNYHWTIYNGDTWQPECTAIGYGHVANYILRSSIHIADYQTRPLVDKESETDKVFILANDRRRIIASGFYEPEGGDQIPFMFYRMLEYVTASAPESHPFSQYIDTPALEEESTSQLFSPSGQSTLSETDWTVESRGFNFTVDRTYKSGTWELYSFMGQTWTSNHDRYLVYDSFHDNISIHKGNGEVVVMDKVHDGGTLGNPTCMSSYVAVNSRDTSVATFYCGQDESELTLENPPVDYVWNDVRGNAERCAGTNHSGEVPPQGSFRSGFVIRDAEGNVAFYAYHEIDIDVAEVDPDNKKLFGNQNSRVKGGELKYYRLAYVMDANGNRQNYYYAKKPYYSEEWTPEELLWCVVDTEGRGNYMDIKWVNTELDITKMGDNGIRLPWLYHVFSADDWEKNGGWNDYAGLFYNYYSGRDNCGTAVNQTYYGLLMEQTNLLKGESESERIKKYFNYEWLYMPCGSQSWGHHIVPLVYVTDWKYDSELTKKVHQFEYEEPYEDTRMDLSDVHYYMGKVTAHYTGAEAEGPLPLEHETAAEFEYYIRPGVPDRHDLTTPYGWVHILKNEVGETIIFNGHFQVIEVRKWYTSDRCTKANVRCQPTIGSLNLDGDPGACDDWATVPAPPGLPCDGNSWVWEFENNLDGQVIYEADPSGKTVQHNHVFEWVLNDTWLDPDLPVDEQVHDFWKNYWHLRYWFANEVKTITTGDVGELDVKSVTVEPVYNQPLKHYHFDDLQRESRYDYLEFNEGLDSDQLLIRMLMPDALTEPGEDPWNWSWGGGGYPYGKIENVIFGGLEWQRCISMPSGMYEEGNPVCENKPATTTHGESEHRDAVAATMEFDEWGREHRVIDFEGQQKLIDYSPWTAISQFGTKKVVSRIGSTGGIDTAYYYDGRGLNVIKEQRVDQGSTQCIYEYFDYDGLGRLVRKRVLEDVCFPVPPMSIVAAKQEEYQYDANGNAILAKTVCPDGWTTEQCEDGSLNEAGQDLRHIKVFDSKGRPQWECKEIRDDGVQESFACGANAYGYDDKIVRSMRLGGECFVNKSTTDIETAVRNCAANWTDFELIDESYYDERALRHEARSYRPEESPPYELDLRETRTFHDPIGRVAAFEDSADSDGNGYKEWTRKIHSGIGRLLRETAGMDDPTEWDDPSAVRTVYEYDIYGNVVRETRGRPTGTTCDETLGYVDREYDERMSLVSETVWQYPVGSTKGTSGVTTFWSYDQDDRVITEHRKSEATGKLQAQFTDYDEYGRMSAYYGDFTNGSIDYTVDNLGRVIEEYRLDYSTMAPTVGHVETRTRFDYDESGNLTLREDVSVDDPMVTHPTIFYYDYFGNLRATTDPAGQDTYQMTEGRGNVVATMEMVEGYYWPYYTTTPYGYMVNSAAYDVASNVICRVDSPKDTTSQGTETFFLHNVHGDVVEVDRPAPAADTRYVKRFMLNDDGAMTAIEHWRKELVEPEPIETMLKVVDMNLDRYNKPIAVRENGAESQSFQYDGLGNLTYAFDENLGITDAEWVETNRSWDTFGNLLSDKTTIRDSSGVDIRETTASYDGPRLTELATPNGSTMLVNYHADLDLPETILANQIGLSTQLLAEYEWVGGSVLQERVDHPTHTGRLLTRHAMGVPTFDGFGNLQEQLVVRHDNGVPSFDVADYDYAYNDNDRLTSEENAVDDTYDVTYTLDDLDRVLSYHRGSLAVEQYNLDEVNNIRQMQTQDGWIEVTIDDGEHNGLNAITAIDYTEHTHVRYFDYDTYGNMTADNGPWDDQRNRSYTWDGQGRLAVAELDDGLGDWTKAAYAYDGLNRRVRKYVYHDETKPSNVDVMSYALYGTDVVEEEREVYKKRAELWVVLHDPTAIDSYLRWDRYQWLGYWRPLRTYQPITDIRNNVIGVLGYYGLEASLAYDLYGQDTYGGTAFLPYRFAGRRYDEETGLYYNRTRYYNPHVGRFLSIDTLGIWGDLNNYGNGFVYVGNMANQLYDPSGKLWKGLLGFIGLIGGGAIIAAGGPWALAIAFIVAGVVLTVWDAVEDYLEGKERMEQAKRLTDRYTDDLDREIELDFEKLDERNFQDRDPDAGDEYPDSDTNTHNPDDDDEKTAGYDSSLSMTDLEGESAVWPEEIEYLSAIGAIKTEPDVIWEWDEHFYDKPGTDIWAFRNRHLKQEKNKRPISDDGRFYFRDLKSDPPWWSSGEVPSIVDPGWIDPLPNP